MSASRVIYVTPGYNISILEERKGSMNPRQRAAGKALELVQDGMTLGLGSGATAGLFIDAVGEALRRGDLRRIRGVPTSTASEERARRWGIPLISLVDIPELDLAVDGADEVDPHFNLIKGLGRALLREKIVEIHARRFVVVVDPSKLTPRLGRGPLPVEIVQFEAGAQLRWLNTLGCRAELWREDDGRPVVTDNGNFLARCWFPGQGQGIETGEPGIPDPFDLARQLAERPGIVEHGLFLGMAHQVIVGKEDGVDILERSA